MFSPVVLWIVFLTASLIWNIRTVDKNMVETVKSIGRSFFNEIETTRLWNARHGGVYVPITENTQPNPYLEDPNRDVTTTEGLQLTKINPAFMTRQIAEIAKVESNIQYHITSLKPIRPANKPDGWETETLKGFEAGNKELFELSRGKMVYRYMAPLSVKKACLQCHAKQGYQLGDIRGGISLTIPARRYVDTAQALKNFLIIIHAIALVLGIGVTYFVKRSRDKQMELRDQKNLALEQAKTAAELANRTKSKFLSNMSHELRTPLNAVLGFSQLMRNDPATTGDQRENLQIINRSGEHLLTLINDVLDMSKIEAGRIILEPEDFDLGDLIRDVVDMMRVRAEQKVLQLILDQSSDFPRYIHADPAKLRQVLINLLGNAVKYTEEGGITLRLKATPEEEAGKVRLICEVEDTGIGIAREDLGHIFEAFEQVGGQAGIKGTGLGLAIARQYVELMGGELTVKSEPGRGSVFRFEIPVETVTAADIEHLEPSRGRIIGLEPDQPTYRILIAEDQLESRLLLKKLLEPVGFEVREALNGQEAIEVFEEWRPHFIWMDRRMPLMDGLEATRRIKAMEGGKETIIVALTASVFNEQRDEVLEAGCDDFLRKPFREVEIFDAMEKHLSVRYVYAEEQPMTTAEAAKMDLPSSEVLAALPPELLASLSKAVEEIDLKAAEQIIRRIGVDNKALAKSLANLVKDFRFDTLQNLVMESMK